MVNIVGDHATYHRQYDAPLTSDIEGLARPNSHWVKTSPDSKAIAGDGAFAIAAARQPPGRIATLILPADTAWNEGSGPASVAPSAKPALPSADAIEVGGARASLAPADADPIERAGGARTGPRARRPDRREDRSAAHRPVYERAHAARPRPRLSRAHSLCCRSGIARVGRPQAHHPGRLEMPVAFFAYPDKPSKLYPDDCQEHVLARPDEDQIAALEMLCEAVGARQTLPPVTTSGPMRLQARSPRRHWVDRSARCCRKTRSLPTRH